MLDDQRAIVRAQAIAADDEQEIDLFELLGIWLSHWKRIGAISFAAGVIGLAVAFVLPKWYTATSVILPPQQQQSSAAAALSQLGALAGLAGGLANVKSPADQYVALMESVTVVDRIIDKFKLMEVYDKEYREDARKKLKENTRIAVGKKDGLITIQVDDRDPKRAAEIANAFVDGLRYMTNNLAVSEAQQRRLFFEQQMTETKQRLTKAQVALGGSGIGEGALKAEPKSAAEAYATLRAQATAAEVKLQTLRRMLAENAPEVIQAEATLTALRAQVARAEAQDNGTGSTDYINRYREFKYQETLFDIFAKQYELAKVDESREGALIQVVDTATPPERKAGPKRALIALAAALLGLLGACVYFAARHLRRQTPPTAGKP